MNKIHISRFIVLTGVVILLVHAGCLLIPDDKVEGERVANLRPTVRITGGAATPDPVGVDYKVQFFWSGSDVDGVINFYQWAVDDTVTEGAWRDTTGFSARFNFKAARQVAGTDSIFTDWHTFYIRAIDNEFSFSKPEKRYFNARTIAPTSRISFPENLEAPAQLQRTVAVRWEGQDIDSSRPDHKPEWFEYKLVRVATIPAADQSYVDSLRHGQNLLDSLGIGAKSKWIRVPKATTEVTLRDLPADGLFAFGVRAVDEAGAIEPSLENNRNFIAFAVTGDASQPTVEVRELSLGTFRFPGNGNVWELSVPPGVPLRFRWIGNARAYGSRDGNANYALDIPDPENESLRDPKGIGGWIGWGMWRSNQSPFTFTVEQGGTTHYLYILMRDISNARTSTRRCIIKMKVVPFTFSKSALVVDDARFADLLDAPHDAYLSRSILHRLRGLPEVDDFQIWRGYNEGGTSPAILRLEDVADYQTIAWSLNLVSTANNGLGEERNEAVLSSYLKAGGRLFVFGAPIVGMNMRQLAYPRDPPETDREKAKLYFRFLYMQNEIVSGIPTTAEACFVAKSGLWAARSANPAYPDLFIDQTKWNPWGLADGEYRGGSPTWEGNMVGMNQVPAQFEGLDTLYTAETWNRSIRSTCGTYHSSIEGAIIGARYESTKADTLEGRQHGRVLYLNFQPWWFQENRMMDAGTAAVNWLFTGRDQ